MSLKFHDKDNGAFPYSDEQTAARTALGETLHKLLSKQGVLESLGAHVVFAKDKGTDAQAKRWAKNGRTSMVELSIPIAALSIDIDGAPTAMHTKALTVTLNAVIDTGKPEPVKAAKPVVPAPKALTYAELRQMQFAGRESLGVAKA